MGGEGVEGSADREFFPLNPVFSLRAPHEQGGKFISLPLWYSVPVTME